MYISFLNLFRINELKSYVKDRLEDKHVTPESQKNTRKPINSLSYSHDLCEISFIPRLHLGKHVSPSVREKSRYGYGELHRKYHREMMQRR